MLGFAASLLMRFGVGEKLAKVLGPVILVGLVLGLVLGAVSCIRSDAAKDERARQAVQIERDKAVQTERERMADEERRVQEIKAQSEALQRRQEIDDATRNIPDQAPSARQRSRACIELRRQHAASGSRDPAPC